MSMPKPQFVGSYDAGFHNTHMDETIKRVKGSSQWKKLDTIWLTPAGGSIPTKVVASWLNVYAPPNNKLFRMFAIGQEVGEAFSTAIENILAHPDLSKFKYLFTVEHDNMVPPDGLVRLLEQMEAHPEFACIGASYFTKGPEGVFQGWGDPRDPEINYRPQIPVPGKLVEVCGTGMGCNVWRLEMFKDKRLRKPWFKTLGSIDDHSNSGVATQDLYAWGDFRRHGYRCAIACDIQSGHYCLDSDMVW
jgi:hypothetical protein